MRRLSALVLAALALAPAPAAARGLCDRVESYCDDQCQVGRIARILFSARREGEAPR